MRGGPKKGGYAGWGRPGEDELEDMADLNLPDQSAALGAAKSVM